MKTHINLTDHYSCIWSFSGYWLRMSILTLRQFVVARYQDSSRSRHLSVRSRGVRRKMIKRLAELIAIRTNAHSLSAYLLVENRPCSDCGEAIHCRNKGG
jgi:hypothetical protein